MRRQDLFSCIGITLFSLAFLTGCPVRPTSKSIYECVSDPTYSFGRQQTVAFVPIYWYTGTPKLPATVGEQQSLELFGTRMTGMKPQPIFWEPGEKNSLTELQEKQMYGYFKRELEKRGYSTAYFPLERTSLHGKNTASSLQKNDFDVYSNSLDNANVDTLPGDTTLNAFWNEFTLPLKPDNLAGDSIRVRYRGPSAPDMILQAYFWQVTGVISRNQGQTGAFSTTPNVPVVKKENKSVLCIRLDVWADPPYYRNQVWSGAIMRSADSPNLKEQASQMISELLATQHFPSRIDTLQAAN